MSNKFDRAYVMYSTDNYIETIKSSIKSIRQFSKHPILVYLLNSNKSIEIDNVITIPWKTYFDVDLNSLNINHNGDNHYIDRSNINIYKILIERPKIVSDALKNYAKTVVYVDSDSIATPRIDNIFNLYHENCEYPHFVEGVYDWLYFNGNGGPPENGNYNNTLEQPLCELLNVNQSNRIKYRQTGYFISGQNSINFLDEWYWNCLNPKIVNNHTLYAPFHEETIVNVLLWKHNYSDGLPYLYVNASIDKLEFIYDNLNYDMTKKEISSFFVLPPKKDDILFFHGEKRSHIMDKMLNEIKKYESYDEKKLKILYLAPHLSTGGMPSFLLKRIEGLIKYQPNADIFVVEYSNYSDIYTVHRNKIINLIPNNRFWSLGPFGSDTESKMKLMDIIKHYNIDIVHVDEILEGFDSFNKVPDELIDALYSKHRTWRVVETCHNIWFDPRTSKKYSPDGYSFCTEYHKLKTFSSEISPNSVIQYPFENKIPDDYDKLISKRLLNFNENKINILNVGLWTSGKNQEEIIKIARIMETTNPEYHFHLVGNLAPNFEEYWSRLIHNLPSNVTVWNERSDVSVFMKACDVFLFTSTWECNPIVLKEAVSHGLNIFSRNLPQYLDTYTPYITEIDDNIYDTIHKIINVSKPYTIPENELYEFSINHINFYNKLKNLPPIVQPTPNPNVTISQNFVIQPYLELHGVYNNSYLVQFYDENDTLHYENTLTSNSWVKLNREYYTKWRTKVWENNTLIYDKKLDYKDKRVYIAFDSSSLGDTIAWIPYCLEFKKTHTCHVIVSTFWNHLFDEVYPELEFIKPGDTAYNIHGMYKIGWFNDSNKEPVLPNTIPLQKTICNILGLDYKEIKPKINPFTGNNPYNQKYITISTSSTAGCKLWDNTYWMLLCSELKMLGYKVIDVSKEPEPIPGVDTLSSPSIANTINVINHSEFFIGLSSGLSWLSWALDKHVVMISNFTEKNHEFTSNCTRIINESVCHGCWNKFKFDKSDWYWCPIHKNTEKQFECHKSITPNMVINQIKTLIHE